jgi:hypothetical protein
LSRASVGHCADGHPNARYGWAGRYQADPALRFPCQDCDRDGLRRWPTLPSELWRLMDVPLIAWRKGMTDEQWVDLHSGGRRDVLAAHGCLQLTRCNGCIPCDNFVRIGYSYTAQIDLATSGGFAIGRKRRSRKFRPHRHRNGTDDCQAWRKNLRPASIRTDCRSRIGWSW